MTSTLETSPSSSEAPTLVLLSGMLGDESVWQDVLEALTLPIATLCLRTDGAESVRQVASAALDAAPASFALAGHSFGGIVALEMQRQAPQRVERLALLSASAREGSATQQESWATLRARTLSGEFDSVAPELAVVTLAEQHRADRLVAWNVAMAQSVGPAGLLRQLTAQSTRPDSLPSLQAIRVPTLVVMGELDQVCPAVLQHEVAHGIAGSVTAVVPGAGHMTPLEAPEHVASLLDEWLTAPLTAQAQPGTARLSTTRTTGEQQHSNP